MSLTDLHLNDGGAQVKQSPARRQFALFGECLVERGRRQFEVEFLGQLGDGGDEPFGQVFAGERCDGWWCRPPAGLPQEQQRGQSGTAGDEDRGEMMVFDTKLLSRNGTTPAGAGNGARVDDLPRRIETPVSVRVLYLHWDGGSRG